MNGAQSMIRAAYSSCKPSRAFSSGTIYRGTDFNMGIREIENDNNIKRSSIVANCESMQLMFNYLVYKVTDLLIKNNDLEENN